MDVREFITKLKNRMNADGVILSEGDAFEMLENNGLQADEIELIIDSDYLLSSNIAVAEKYKALQEFTVKYNVKHLKMTESGTICNAAIRSGLLSKEKIYSSASCKIVAPYFEEGYAVLPCSSREFQTDNHADVFILKLSEELVLNAEPEIIALNIIEKITLKHDDKLRFVLLESSVYNALGKSKRIRFFSILSSFNLLGFELSDAIAVKDSIAEVYETVEIKEIAIDKIKNLCTRYENIVSDETIDNETSGKFDRVFLGGCSAGDLQTLNEIAEYIDGKTLRKNVDVIVTPADFGVYKQAVESGILAKLSKAGFTVAFPSCASCKGNHSGIIASDEKILSTYPLAEVGRMGHADASVFRCSTHSILKKIMQ